MNAMQEQKVNEKFAEKNNLSIDEMNMKAQEIYNHFKGRIKVSFGIGTFVTNDTCVAPLNIVIKLQYVNGRPVAKLSDEEGKSMCQDEEYLAYLRSAVNRRLKENAKKFVDLPEV